LPTNEEYLQRWEDAAPEAIQGEPAVARRSTKSYDEELTPIETDSALIEAMAEYASRVSDAEASSQTKEELARLKEGAAEQAKEYQWAHPKEYANEPDRIGHIMHSIVFLHRLKQAGVNCWYRCHPQVGKLTLVVQPKAGLEPEVGCWVQSGFMPELSTLRFDDHGVPLDEKFRGWRTGLLQCILKSYLTEKKANEIFGKPSTTPAFSRYNQTLRSFRNNGSRLDE
jgi:hypothetical protein